MPVRKTIDSPEIKEALTTMVATLAERHGQTDSLIVVGIADGGVELARRLTKLLDQALGRTLETGVVNVAFQRDDIGQNPIPKQAAATHLPADVDNATVLLVDDVLSTGRTIRAAIEELFSIGRPGRVELAVLVDRGHHCLPFSADVAGFVEETDLSEDVVVNLNQNQPADDRITITSRD
ncbi:MAG: bifunctional pyr operon transcriptional regulator/uracil phosphoribosyltransferase PyrR [Verrucomicrobia bacterium]|nr:MAG: bifunctional pyr operon transcriptional regulator/uracil phosphoribosyltransferase PyrR [Verrucomicrobiota bacterium]